MLGSTSPLKQAIIAAKSDLGPRGFGREERSYECPFCRHDRYSVGQYVAALGMHTLVCAACSQVLFFEKLPDPIEGAERRQA